MRRRRYPIDHIPRFDDAALNITFACDNACVGCNRACFLKPPHTPAMTRERLMHFFAEVQSNGIRLKRMRIIGGEPTLHPEFTEIVAMVANYARSTGSGCRVRLYSTTRTERAKRLVAEVKREFPNLKLFIDEKEGPTTFPPLTRYIFVDPKDAGINCPWPCPIMGGRGMCGYGVDQLGYSLCPTAGTIDTLLGLNSRAKELRQMLDPDFVRWQAETVCAECGNYIGFEKLPRVWDHNRTPMSKAYHERLR